MTAQDIKDIVEEKCRLIDKIEAENEGLEVGWIKVYDLPLKALREYADNNGQTIHFDKPSKAMRVHYSTYPYCVFLHSNPVKVETHIVEDTAIQNV